jgi:hypothetical protein
MIAIIISNVFFFKIFFHLIFPPFDTFTLSFIEIEFNVLFHLALYRYLNIKNMF